jgi:hypothetical protein
VTKARDKVMSPADWAAWLDAMGISGNQAAAALGISTNAPVEARKSGAGLTIALACSALAAGLGPWNPANARDAALAREIQSLIRTDRMNNDTSITKKRHKS